MVVSEGAINNIMGGMENTSGVRLHSHRHKLKQRFDIVRKLGQGTYGKVQLAVNKETGQEVAIKTIKKAKIETEQDLVRIRREIQIMSSVQHPQIIHIYEVFENREKMVLVMEYAAGGELYDYLSERKVLAELEARRIFRQVASAVYYCHKHKICHRDLKLENILLDLEGNAKIADFGLSNVFDEKRRLDTFCGSPLYASPEIVKGVPYVGPEVDCWSLGVLLYTLVYGAMPFDGSNFRRLVKQITQGDFYEPSTPANASELIRHMLSVQTAERATVEEICSHWWVNEGYQESCLIEAEALASQTPVRLDLLLSLAPKHISSEHLLIQPEDDDISQRSDSSQAPPDLQLPPPPSAMEDDMENANVPARSQSLGSLPPGSSIDIDLLLEKKRQERQLQEEKKRPNEDAPKVEMKKKKESISKKPPAKPSLDDVSEKKKSIIKKDENEEKKVGKEKKEENDNKKDGAVRNKEGTEVKRVEDSKKSSVNKREPSAEKEISKKTDKKVVRKGDSDMTRKLSNKKGDENKEMVKESKAESIIERKAKTEDDTKSKESSLSVPRRSPSPPPSTDITMKASDSSVSQLSLSPVKTVPSKATAEKSEVNELKETPSKVVRKVGSFASRKLQKSTEPVPSDSNTEKILQETAAKMECVEDITKKEGTIPSNLAASSVASSQHSVASSQDTTPARSRTGSESSTETRPTRSDSSRRQSKVFSKAAMFDTMLSQGSKSPPPADKTKKISRPGALNMSDLAKKFEEKQPVDKKSKVVTPFKVSDARKAFEAKTEKSTSESPLRKASLASSEGSQSASPRASLPTSPSREEKSPLVSPSESYSASLEIPAAVKSDSKNETVKEPSSVKEKPSPSRTIAIKSDSKALADNFASTTVNNKKEKSPLSQVPSSISRKEKSPSPTKEKENIQPKPVKVSSTAKLKEILKTDDKPTEVKDNKLKEKTEKSKPPAQKPESKISRQSPKSKTVPVEKLKEEPRSKTEAPAKTSSVTRIIDVKVDTSDSSDSESEAEKLLKLLSEKRERLEQAKKERLKKVSADKEATESLGKEMPSIKEEKRTTPAKEPETLSGGTQLENKEKFATLPRGFKSKVQKPRLAGESIEENSTSGSLGEQDEGSAKKLEPLVGKRIPIVKEVVPIPPEQVLSPTPRTEMKKDLSSQSNLARINSTEDSRIGENQRKKSEMEVVLSAQQAQKKPITVTKPLQPQKSLDSSKNSSFAEIHISTPSVKEVSRPVEYRTEVRHTVIPPDRISIVHPSGIEPQLQRAKRERIIPIMLEDDDDDRSVGYDSRPSPRTSIQQSSSSSSRGSSIASGPSRATNFNAGTVPLSATVGSSAAAEKGRAPVAASPESIRKSKRERIIPIAVEGDSFLTPPVSETASSEAIRGAFQRQGSSQSSFGLEKVREVKRKKEGISLSSVGSTDSVSSCKSGVKRPLRNNSRGRGFMLDRNESFSSAGEDDDDDEDDGFQILTAESLFSTLLSRVRSLTRKMTDDNVRERVRRTPQSANIGGVDNPDSNSHPLGFWSSLYSTTRDSPARRITETLSRAQSREDQFGGTFNSPMWGRSTSRDASDVDTVFSEPSASFSTLPRGWRSRRQENVDSKEEESADRISSASVTSNRRPFYSRTLSRDLPVKLEKGNDSKFQDSWNTSSAGGAHKTSSGQPLPKFTRDSSEKVAALYGTLRQASGNLPRRPHSTVGTSTPSGEATGRVGGQYEQREITPQTTAQVSSPIQSKTIQSDFSKGNESVQQLKDLVHELESGSTDNANVPDYIQKKEPQSLRAKTSEDRKGKVATLSVSSSVGKINKVSLKDNRSLAIQDSVSNKNDTVTFDKIKEKENFHSVSRDPISNMSSQCNHSSSISNQLSKSFTVGSGSIIQNQNRSGNYTPTSNQLGLQQHSLDKTSVKSVVKNLEHIKENAVQPSIVNNSGTTSTVNNSGTTSISKTSDATLKIPVRKSIYLDKDQTMLSSRPIPETIGTRKFETPRLEVTGPSKQNADTLENKDKFCLSSWNQSIKEPLNERKNFLTVQPYRRGKSEDLKTAIEMANKAETASMGSSLKPYRKSKSRDINPAIEAVSEKLIQTNSGTMKRISPFEAYRRSKSKELGTIIDQANTINSSGVFKSPEPPAPPQTQPLIASSVISSFRTQPEISKVNLENKVETGSASADPEKVPAQQEAFGIKYVDKDTNVIQNSGNFNRESEDLIEKEKVMKEKTKDVEKPKSVYKIITSKFGRSLSNVGEEFRQPASTHKKETEDESNEKDEKLNLKRPSRYLKTKEKNMSRSSITEIDDEDVVKSEKKATNKLSSALNKFLGRKPEDPNSQIPKASEYILPAKSTSVAVIPEKLKKPPRFRIKKFSKSQDCLNQLAEADACEPKERAKSVFPDDRTGPNVTLESATKGLCNHLSQVENSINSRIGNMTSSHDTALLDSKKPVSTACSVTGLSPSVMNNRGGKPRDKEFSLTRGRSASSLPHDALTVLHEKKLSGDFSDTGSITPNDLGYVLDDIKENEDESVMDRITRKSYYSRFNEVKLKPKLRRIDSKEAMDQQLAAAKARLMQEDHSSHRSTREFLSPCRVISPTSFTSASPPPLLEVTHRISNKPLAPRMSSLPPESGKGYMSGGKSPTFQSQEQQYQSVQSPSRDLPTAHYTSQSVEPEELCTYRRSSTYEDQPSFRTQSLTNDEVPTYRRITSGIRDDPPSYSRRSSMSQEEPHSYHLRSSSTRDETQPHNLLASARNEEPECRESAVLNRSSQSRFDDHSGNNSRQSSVPPDNVRFNRVSKIPKDDLPGYHTLQYRRSSSTFSDSPGDRKYTSTPYGSESGYLSQWSSPTKLSHSGIGSISERFSTKSPPAVSGSSYRRLSSMNALSENNEDSEQSGKAVSAAAEAGKAAGAAAAAAISSDDFRQSIPSPSGVNSPPDSAALVSAREELSRRLTPLTRLSNMAGGDSKVRPYRRTVTSNIILTGGPTATSRGPSIIDRPSYKRTHTMDLPSLDARTSGRGIQDTIRRFSGVRSTDDQTDYPVMSYATSSLPRRSAYSPSAFSPYSGYSSSSYSSVSPTYSSVSPSYTAPSMNSILRRSTLYRY